jgi:DNA-binding NarL/FixJ family response regulator
MGGVSSPVRYPRVWVDDSNLILRRGLVATLTGGGIHVAGQSAGLVPLPDPDNCDVLLFEAERGGLRNAVRASGPSMHLVAMIRSADEELLYAAVEAGVVAIMVHTDLTPPSLLNCVRAAAHGRASLPAELVPAILGRAASGGHREGWASLGRRELAVLRLVAEGESTRDIADKMCYSERTVKNIVHDVLVRMNCRNRAHAVALATRQGII